MIGKFGGLPSVMKDKPYSEVKKWFEAKFSEFDFDKEWKKIGGKIPAKKETSKK